MPVCILNADPGWISAHQRLKELHIEKSSTYGTDGDRLANFTAVADVTGDPPELYPLLRIIEKATRSVNMIRTGQALEVREYPDIASLALCCEALRNRCDQLQIGQELAALLTSTPSRGASV